jgi:hypothetical protein
MSVQRAFAATALMLALAACAPKAPEGVSKTALDSAISDRLGDPSTCVLIGKAGSGDVVYRYNSHVACGRVLPACEGGPSRSTEALLKAVAATPVEVMKSCSTTEDGSRSVGWTAGAVPGKPLVYAAVMEGDKALPGRVMNGRLQRAFEEAGVTAKAATP